MSSHNGGIHYELYKGNRVGHCGSTTTQLTLANLGKNWVLNISYIPVRVSYLSYYPSPRRSRGQG